MISRVLISMSGIYTTIPSKQTAIWPNSVVLTIPEASNTNLTVQSTLYSYQIDLNPATYYYFNARSRGHATGPGRAKSA